MFLMVTSGLLLFITLIAIIRGNVIYEDLDQDYNGIGKGTLRGPYTYGNNLYITLTTGTTLIGTFERGDLIKGTITIPTQISRPTYGGVAITGIFTSCWDLTGKGTVTTTDGYSFDCVFAKTEVQQITKIIDPSKEMFIGEINVEPIKIIPTSRQPISRNSVASKYFAINGKGWMTNFKTNETLIGNWFNGQFENGIVCDNNNITIALVQNGMRRRIKP